MKILFKTTLFTSGIRRSWLWTRSDTWSRGYMKDNKRLAASKTGRRFFSFGFSFRGKRSRNYS